MKNFKKLLIWQKGFQIAINSFRLVSGFPNAEKFSLSSQITRSASSIAANIAEGSSRSSVKEYKRFLEIALGSCFEFETHLLIAEAANFGKKEDIQDLLKQIDEEQKMIMSFIKKLIERTQSS